MDSQPTKLGLLSIAKFLLLFILDIVTKSRNRTIIRGGGLWGDGGSDFGSLLYLFEGGDVTFYLI